MTLSSRDTERVDVVVHLLLDGRSVNLDVDDATAGPILEVVHAKLRHAFKLDQEKISDAIERLEVRGVPAKRWTDEHEFGA
ncbi:MAG: hypothetical protein F4Z28_18065 [Gammaproteobacteria bacterium]|nr:hypothetical protein [Gammaproteobacteria bacterium]